MRIMIVEDEKYIGEGLKKIIENIIGGFTVVRVAENGKEALEYFEMDSVDIILTDIRMPQMNGLELIRRIRVINDHVPILIISGHSDFEYAKQALRYNVQEYILKPVDRSELTMALHRARQKILERQGDIGQPVQDTQRKVIARAQEYVRKNLQDTLELRMIADMVHLNPQYFSTLFKMETGMTFSEYVTSMRIEKAKELLSNTNIRVYNIATVCGYASPKHFMNTFKKLTGVTPTEFRESHREL